MLNCLTMYIVSMNLRYAFPEIAFSLKEISDALNILGETMVDVDWIHLSAVGSKTECVTHSTTLEQ